MRLKVLLLGFVRISHMPYMYDYVSLLHSNHELHLISWNRNGEADLDAPKGITKSFVFSDLIEDEDLLLKKLPRIHRYREYALKIIKRESYDRIIVLHSTPGIALLDFLCKHYRNKYVLDYRDVSHENLMLYRAAISTLSNAAGLVIASSPAYIQFLGNSKNIILKHNLLSADTSGRVKSDSNSIRVRYWGMIRHRNANLAMIDELGNDDRFELHYNGREERVAEELKDYVKKKMYRNVFFHGPYFNDERSSFAAETDIIHNVYENDFATKGAMGNKYYDGIQFTLPQLCTYGSIMGDRVEAKGIGLSVDFEQHGFSDQIVEYLDQLNIEQFEKNCKKELMRINSDNQLAIEAIADYFDCKPTLHLSGDRRDLNESK